MLADAGLDQRADGGRFPGDILYPFDEIGQRFAEISSPAQPMALSCTFSCGIAELHDGVDSKALSKRADEALYEAKHSGRNRSAVYPA